MASQGWHQAVPSAGLTETCRECGQRSLEYLDKLKDRQRLGSAELGDVRGALRGVLQLAQVGDGAQHSHLPPCGSQGTLWGGLSPIPTSSGAFLEPTQLPSTETLPGGAQSWSPSDQLKSFSPVTPVEGNFPSFRYFSS